MNFTFEKQREMISYVFFGLLTTGVNWVIFQAAVGVFAAPWAVANVIAWMGAVLFAYGTNKRYVFRSKDRAIGTELFRFVQCRVVSLLLELAVMFLFIQLFHWALFFSKVATSGIVALTNYLLSRWIVFRKEAD